MNNLTLTEVEAVNEHVDQANTYAGIAAENRGPTDEASYFMLCAIFEAVMGIGVLLQAQAKTPPSKGPLEHALKIQREELVTLP